MRISVHAYLYFLARPAISPGQMYTTSEFYIHFRCSNFEVVFVISRVPHLPQPWQLVLLGYSFFILSLLSLCTTFVSCVLHLHSCVYKSMTDPHHSLVFLTLHVLPQSNTGLYKHHTSNGHCWISRIISGDLSYLVIQDLLALSSTCSLNECTIKNALSLEALKGINLQTKNLR